MPEERGLYSKDTLSEQSIYLAELYGVDRKSAMCNIENLAQDLDFDGKLNKKIE
jgi:ABC-type uncharacterized transport system ATPase subunit